MSASPTPTATAPSQKRPLEEPSSDAGLSDQPEAKRQAVHNITREDSDSSHRPSAELPVKDELTENGETLASAKSTSIPNGVPINASAPGGPDSGLPAPAAVLETQPIQSTATTNGTSSGQGAFSGEPQDESKWLHLRAMISSQEAATIIGKGGENVTQIRKMSGAKCTVSEYARGAVERILTVSGLVDAVAKAFGLIIRTLNNEALEQPSTPQSKTYPLRLLVPHVLIGSIIGQKGVRIREIQDASGARLNASESCLPLSTERSLVVLGVADAVHIATYYVGSTLCEQLNERFGGPASSAYATRTGGPAGIAPGGLQVIPYTPQAAGGQWGHPDSYRRHPTNPQHRSNTNTYNATYAAQQHQHPQQPQQPHAGTPYGAAAPIRGGYAGAGPHAPQPYVQPHAQPVQHHGPPQQAVPHHQGGPMPGQPLTQQIFIPNDMVGAIIGKGGAKINEIRQLSGSVIKINEPQDNSNERLVTITGTPECNQMALYMLYQRLENEKHRI